MGELQELLDTVVPAERPLTPPCTAATQSPKQLWSRVDSALRPRARCRRRVMATQHS
jgi:hypothetical protein